MNVNDQVLKAFALDFITSIITAGAVYFTVPENAAMLGLGNGIVPLIVALAGAAVVALRRFRIEAKRLGKEGDDVA